MATKPFAKEDLVDLAYGGAPDGFEIISNTISDTTRWSVLHELIFSFGGEFFRTRYNVGATEQQDEQPFEDEGETVECRQVTPEETTITIYKDLP